jgi:hypothetical protein
MFRCQVQQSSPSQNGANTLVQEHRIAILWVTSDIVYLNATAIGD